MSDTTLNGSCLCGAVSYELVGSFHHFWHCHCTRCRKASGTGHASNILMKPESARWLSGEALVRDYKVPDARFFGTTFCSECGSSLPRFGPDRGIAVVPAGSLDHDVEQLPEGRIYQGSKSGWSCDSDELPRYDTYPART